MAGKLKGFDAKQFLINHGEKLGLGFIGLLVLYALGTANWVPYNGNPRDIVNAANEARQKYESRVITPQDEEELQLVVKADERPGALVDKHILNDWSAGRYDLRVIMAVSPSDKDDPFKEPAFNQHPIKNLIATATRVVLNLGPELPPAPPPTAAPATPMPPGLAAGGRATNPDLDERFGRRTGMVGAAGAEGSEYYAPELAYFTAAGGMSGEGSGELSYAGTKLRGRGQPCVAVRGIIPLHELLRDVMEARHCGPTEAAGHFQLIDYILERQTMNRDGTWPADDQGWEEVDRATAENILNEVDGFDLDPVPPALTDTAVTMPLPPLITGYWKSRATHPDIENYSLSEKDMDNELKFQRTLLKKVQDQEAQLKAAVPAQQVGPEKKGWSHMIYNSRRLTAELMGDTSYENNYGDINQSDMGMTTVASVATDPRFKQLVDDLSKAGSKSPTDADKALREYITKRISAVGNVLLFRYLDFAVEPGQTYRYRARLVLENPNFGERVASAVEPGVVEGETRMNAWSNITEPASIERDTYYFVNKVDVNRSLALFDFFHFDPALGTIVSNTEPDNRDDPATFNSVPRLEVGFGQPIGGSPVVWELNPAAMTFEKDEADVKDDGDGIGYTFQSGDVLVTAMERMNINRLEHPDLKIPREQNFDLQLVEAVLIQKKGGGFDMVDTISQAPMQTYQAYILQMQNEPYKDLKAGKALAAGEEYDPIYEGEMDAISESGARRTTTRTRTALRKSSSRADESLRDLPARGGSRGPSP